MVLCGSPVQRITPEHASGFSLETFKGQNNENERHSQTKHSSPFYKELFPKKGSTLRPTARNDEYYPINNSKEGDPIRFLCSLTWNDESLRCSGKSETICESQLQFGASDYRCSSCRKRHPEPCQKGLACCCSCMVGRPLKKEKEAFSFKL